MNENDTLLEELVTKAEKVENKIERVIDKGKDGERPPMVITHFSDAGTSLVWDTVTHEQSKVNNNMLRSILKRTRPDGSRVFTTIRPKELPKRGIIKCLLHPDNPNRQHYNEIGLPVCMKSNITSPYELKRHMQRRHKTAWEALEEERIQKERDEDRALQRALIEASRGNITKITPEEIPFENLPVYQADHPYKSKKRK